MVEAAVVGGLGDIGEDLLQVLPEDPAPGRARQLGPVGLAEPDRGHRAIEVLERAAPWLGADELDRAEIVQQPDVVADPPEREAELARELVRARGAPVQHAEQAVPKRVGDRSEERLIELACVLRRCWRFGLGHVGFRRGGGGG